MPPNPDEEQDRWVLGQETLVWGPALRQLLWIVAIRRVDHDRLWGLYHSIMDEETFESRIYGKIRDMRKELRAPKTEIVAAKQFDDFGCVRAAVTYYPADRYLHQQELRMLNIERDPASSTEFVLRVVDDLLLQGVPKDNIIGSFSSERVYADLFSRFNPQRGEAVPLECPSEVLEYVRECQGEEFRVLECSIERLIEHAPTTEIGMKLRTFKRVYKVEPQKGRSLPAKKRWFQAWDAVLQSAVSADRLAKLREIDLLVAQLR